MTKFIKDKDPQAVLDYVFDWSRWLPTGDTISAKSVSADAGITVNSSSFTSTTVTVWLSGGTAGTTYNVTCHITTTGGRQDDRTLTIKCKDL